MGVVMQVRAGMRVGALVERNSQLGFTNGHQHLLKA